MLGWMASSFRARPRAGWRSRSGAVGAALEIEVPTAAVGLGDALGLLDAGTASSQVVGRDHGLVLDRPQYAVRQAAGPDQVVRRRTR